MSDLEEIHVPLLKFQTSDIEHDNGVMEHCVNIEKETAPVSTEVITNFNPGENLLDSSRVSIEINETVQLMNKEIHGLPPLFPEPCIFKVHKGLRNVNEKAYTPILLSIGPYHHGNPNLRAMEEHKLRYLHSLLRRINHSDTVNVEPYLLHMEKLAGRAQACYADPICVERHQFVKMMLLDACFIIEFLRKLCYEELRDKDDPIFRTDWMSEQIIRDLLLLENQLPFFVLSELLDITHIPNSNYVPLPLIKMAVRLVNGSVPRQYTETKMEELIEKRSAGESKHFLDLVDRFYLPSSLQISDSGGHQNCTQMSCVTELQEAGIRFEVDDSKDVGIFDISFEHDQMKIPKFIVQDGTETFLRNIIAYEQHSSTVEPKYFTDYMCIMDSLINTEKDVNELRLQGIMENMLGDDEVVACMFKKLGDGVIIVPSTFCYSHVCQKVNEHCGKPWNRAKAMFRRDYFNNPWASISTVAAVVLLSLTLTQTVISLIDELG